MKAQIKIDVAIKVTREDYNKLQNMSDELIELQRQLDGIEDINDLANLLDNTVYSINEFCDDPRVEILD